jgi:hypothetical protein
MPPRKSDSSKAVTVDEGAAAGLGAGTNPGPSTAAKKEDGINIEVITSILALYTACTNKPNRI